jgi:uncharacterized protein YjiS (DUF1127 family)
MMTTRARDGLGTQWGDFALGFGTLLRLPALWRARLAERRHLAELDDRLLDDAGLDRGHALEEAQKPFWQA